MSVNKNSDYDNEQASQQALAKRKGIPLSEKHVFFGFFQQQKQRRGRDRRSSLLEVLERILRILLQRSKALQKDSKPNPKSKIQADPDKGAERTRCILCGCL